MFIGVGLSLFTVPCMPFFYIKTINFLSHQLFFKLSKAKSTLYIYIGIKLAFSILIDFYQSWIHLAIPRYFHSNRPDYFQFLYSWKFCLYTWLKSAS